MKKIIVATMMLATAGMMQSSLAEKIPAQLKDIKVQSVLAATAFHFYRNGVACPLTKNAQAPVALGAAVVAGRTAYNYFEKPVAKYGVTGVCTVVGLVALLQAKK